MGLSKLLESVMDREAWGAAVHRVAKSCSSGVGCGMHGREAHEGGYLCILVADSCCCAAEINTTL